MQFEVASSPSPAASIKRLLSRAGRVEELLHVAVSAGEVRGIWEARRDVARGRSRPIAGVDRLVEALAVLPDGRRIDQQAYRVDGQIVLVFRSEPNGPVLGFVADEERRQEQTSVP